MQLFTNNVLRQKLVLFLLAAAAIFATTCTKEIIMQQDPPGQLQVPQLAPGSDNLYFIVEQMPYFNEEDKGYAGFREFISENIRYPEEASEQGIEGRVFVQLTVKADGSVGNVNVVRGADPLLDREAVRVVEASPRWNPGMQDGKPVNVVFTMPVTFLLPGKEPEGEVFTKTVTSSPPKGEPEEEVFFKVEVMPDFQGGGLDAFLSYIAENIRYPQEAAEEGVQGRVFVEFIVRKDGSVTDAKIVRGVDPLLDKEALRVVSASPQWVPGMQRGQEVDVKFTFPVIFQLKE